MFKEFLKIYKESKRNFSKTITTSCIENRGPVQWVLIVIAYNVVAVLNWAEINLKLFQCILKGGRVNEIRLISSGGSRVAQNPLHVLPENGQLYIPTVIDE